MKKVFSIICILALVACNLKLFTSINISDILSDEHKVVMADLKVYVTSCDENNIQEIQTELSKRNITAHYNKCTQDDAWNDYANFSFPLTIVKDNNNKPVQTSSDIYFYYSSGKFLLKTSSRLEALLKSDSDFASKIKISSIEFALVNDTNETVKIKPIMVFVDEKPILSDVIAISPYQKINIKLSNVANNLLEKSNIVYPVFEFASDIQQPMQTQPQHSNRIGTVVELN